MILAALPIVVFLVAIPVVYRALVCNDRVLEGLYRNHRDIWLRIGSPRGWSWRAPEDRGLFPQMVITLRRAPPVWLEQAPELEVEYSTGQRMSKIWSYVAMPIFAGSIVITAIAGFSK
jgi:hypothetical protein